MAIVRSRQLARLGTAMIPPLMPSESQRSWGSSRVELLAGSISARCTGLEGD